MPLHACKPRNVTKGNGKVVSVVAFPRLDFDWHEYIVHLNDTILKTTGSFLVQNLWKACMVVRMRLVGACNFNHPAANRPLFKANLPWSPYDLHCGHDLHDRSRFRPLKGITTSTQACNLDRKAVEKVDVGVSSELGDISGAKANACVIQSSPKPTPKSNVRVVQPPPKPSAKENVCVFQLSIKPSRAPSPKANTCIIQPSPKANTRVIQPSPKPNVSATPSSPKSPPKENTHIVQPPPKGHTFAIPPSPTPSLQETTTCGIQSSPNKENTCNAPSSPKATTFFMKPSELEDVVDGKAHHCTLLEETVDEAHTCGEQPLVLDEESVTEIAKVEGAVSGPSCASVEQVAPIHVWDSNSEQWESTCTHAPTPTPSSTTTTDHETHVVITQQQDVWCVHGRKMVFKNPSGWPTSPAHRGSEFLQEMGLSSHQQCQTWDLLWERGKPKKVSKLLWNVLSKNLPVGASRAALEGEEEVSLRCARCSETLSIETIRHCLYDCPKASEVWGRIARFHKHLGITEPMSWDRVLLGYPEVLKIHEHLHRARSRDCLSQERRRLRDLLKKMTPLYIWELVRAITLWAIWAARCSFVCYKHEVPVEVVILRIWKELVSTTRLVQQEIMEKLLSHQHDAAHRLGEMFWVCYDYKDTIFRKGNQGKLLWFKSPPLWLLHPA